jgi:hypothetical protein
MVYIISFSEYLDKGDESRMTGRRGQKKVLDLISPPLQRRGSVDRQSKPFGLARAAP